MEHASSCASTPRFWWGYLWSLSLRLAILVDLTDVTRILSRIDQGDPHAAEQLLPLVYDELRKLAAAKLVHEPSGQTLQGTALVHEAYLRLVRVPEQQRWTGRGHFFAAAAEAMRRILVENARKKQALQRCGDRRRVELELNEPTAPRGPSPFCAPEHSRREHGERDEHRTLTIQSQLLSTCLLSPSDAKFLLLLPLRRGRDRPRSFVDLSVAPSPRGRRIWERR